MRTIISASLIAALAALASPATAQEPPAHQGERSEADAWYYESGQQKLTPLQVHQQKSAQRAAQRQSRMASMAWYGMSNARPIASSTPYTGLYSPTWQYPGGRPNAWYPRSYMSTVLIVR